MPARKPSQAFMNRFLAFALTQLTYRDTDLLENHHASSEPLSMDFYDRMLIEVQDNFDNLYPRILQMINGTTQLSEDDGILYDELFVLLRSMNEWLPPQKVHDRFTGTVAEFVLNGEFLAACSQQFRLTDKLMMTLNMDVHNRYYTLVCRNVLR